MSRDIVIVSVSALVGAAALSIGLGFLQAKRRTFRLILVVAIVVGAPIGFLADGWSSGDGPDCGMIGVPLELLFLGWVGYGVGRLVRRRAGLDNGFRCLECDYDLTSIQSGVCPECGSPITHIIRRAAPNDVEVYPGPENSEVRDGLG